MCIKGPLRQAPLSVNLHKSQEGLVEPQEGLVKPREGLVEPRERLVEPRECLVKPQKGLVEPREGLPSCGSTSPSCGWTRPGCNGTILSGFSLRSLNHQIPKAVISFISDIPIICRHSNPYTTKEVLATSVQRLALLCFGPGVTYLTMSLLAPSLASIRV